MLGFLNHCSQIRILCLFCIFCLSLNLYFITTLTQCSEDDSHLLKKQINYYQGEIRNRDSRIKEIQNNLQNMEDKVRKLGSTRSFFQNKTQLNLPMIYAITPTHARMEQKADLTRLSHTLLHVPNFHWIVVEDSDSKTDIVTKFLKRCRLSYTHLNVLTPANIKMSSSDPNWLKPRGVLQRNMGIQWILDNLDPSRHKGIVYFLDDDNTYDLRVFEEMRTTKKVSVWPVGLVGNLRYESPVVKHGKVTGWFTYWKPDRPFAMDMAGFAVNLKMFFDFPNSHFSNSVPRGYQESTLLRLMNVTLDDLEPKADNCTKIIVWHTRTEKSRLTDEDKMFKKYGHYSDPLVEV